MKRHSIFLVMLAMSLYLTQGFDAIAQTIQDKEKQTSNIEEFSAQDGTLIEKEFIDVGKFNKCKIQIATFTDLISGTKKGGIRFEYEVTGKYSTDSKIAFLDLDEVDALITSLKIINEKVLPSKSTNYKEVSYSSRSGFQTGCYMSDKFEWKMFLKIEKYDNDSYIWFAPSFFQDFVALLEKSKTMLN